ncbi:hypothetical protein ABIA00_003147 [Bradyrhizobium ottawaense]|uniref:hypothetical protein n=1 Tax=Bradyrhizobium ottawaense TaxID=931866 RepID=UPI003837EAAC
MKCNKQLSLAGINAFGTSAFGSESSSADLPAAPVVKAPAPVYPRFSWAGGYIGGSVGAGWGTSQTDLAVGNTFIGAPVNQTVNQLIGGTADLNAPLPQVQMNRRRTSRLQLPFRFDGLRRGRRFLWSGIKGRTGFIDRSSAEYYEVASLFKVSALLPKFSISATTKRKWSWSGGVGSPANPTAETKRSHQ